MPVTSTADADAVRPTARRRANPWIRRALLFVGCAILLESLFGDRGFAEKLRARREYARANAELKALKDRNAALREEMHRLASDPAAIEAVARQELGLARPAEILIVVKDVK
jgi:cell division protein FtsB